MRKLAFAAVVVAVGSVGVATPAYASATDPRPNVGYCISDGFYGNQPNLDSNGNVVPSQSPGPWKTVSDGTVKGNSVGDYNSGRVTGEHLNIAQLCRAYLG